MKLAEAGLAHGFEVMRLSTIWAEALAANVASERILSRIGMTFVGDGTTDTFLGTPSVYRHYSLNRSDWVSRVLILDPPSHA